MISGSSIVQAFTSSAACTRFASPGCKNANWLIQNSLLVLMSFHVIPPRPILVVEVRDAASEEA